MNKIEEFLKSLTKKQLESLAYLLKNNIDGDIDYFIFKVDTKLKEK